MSPPPSARPPTLRACAVCGLLTEGTVRASELGRRWNLDEERPCCPKCRAAMGLPEVVLPEVVSVPAKEAAPALADELVSAPTSRESLPPGAPKEPRPLRVPQKSAKYKAQWKQRQKAPEGCYVQPGTPAAMVLLALAGELRCRELREHFKKDRRVDVADALRNLRSLGLVCGQELTRAGRVQVANIREADALAPPPKLAGQALERPRAALKMAAPSVDAETRAARTKAGVAAAKARGVHVGRPRAAIDISPALALLSEGHGLKTVARMTGISRATLRRRLIEEGLWPVSGQTETPNRSPEP